MHFSLLKLICFQEYFSDSSRVRRFKMAVLRLVHFTRLIQTQATQGLVISNV